MSTILKEMNSTILQKSSPTIEFQEYTLSDMIRENGLEVEQVFGEELKTQVFPETVSEETVEDVQEPIEGGVNQIETDVERREKEDVKNVEHSEGKIKKPIDDVIVEEELSPLDEETEDTEVKYIESNFVKQLRNQIERIKEIISYPTVAACYKDALTNIFTSIDSMVDSYPNVSFKTISKQIINSVDYDLYQNKFKDEFKGFYSMNYNIKHVLKPEELKMFEKKTLPTLRYSLQNLFDELQENIDLSMDRYNLTFFDKEKIYNYFTLKAEIEDMFEELIFDVKNYEKEMVEYAHLLTEHVKKEVMPSLYHNHQILCVQTMNTKKPKIKQCNYFNKQLNEYFKRLYQTAN